MDKINENPGKKPNKYVTRSFIIPVKNWVAKILLADLESILKKIYLQYPFTENEENATFADLQNLKRYNFLFHQIVGLFMEIHLYVNFNSYLFIPQEHTALSNPFQFKKFSLKNTPPPVYNSYINKGYVLIIFEGLFLRKYYKIIETPLHLSSLEQKVNHLNWFLENTILHFFALQIHRRGKKTIEETITYFLHLLGIQKTGLNISAIKKHYQRKKDDLFLIRYLNRYYSYTYHKRYPDIVLIHFYQKLMDGEMTIRQIAGVLGCSLSTIETIFHSHSNTLQKKL